MINYYLINDYYLELIGKKLAQYYLSGDLERDIMYNKLVVSVPPATLLTSASLPPPVPSTALPSSSSLSSSSLSLPPPVPSISLPLCSSSTPPSQAVPSSSSPSSTSSSLLPTSTLPVPPSSLLSSSSSASSSTSLPSASTNNPNPSSSSLPTAPTSALTLIGAPSNEISEKFKILTDRINLQRLEEEKKRARDVVENEKIQISLTHNDPTQVEKNTEKPSSSGAVIRWQNAATDSVHRTTKMKDMLQVLKDKGNKRPADALSRMIFQNKIQKIELDLYSKAKSLKEYLDKTGLALLLNRYDFSGVRWIVDATAAKDSGSASSGLGGETYLFIVDSMFIHYKYLRTCISQCAVLNCITLSYLNIDLYHS